MVNSRKKTVLKAFLWAASVMTVFVIGMYYFPREYPELTLLETFYYTIRLFILEHDLPSFPKCSPLIFIYFFAPLVAISALWSAVTYLFRFSPILITRWQKEHVVVCGVGRTGRLLAETFKARGIPVVCVDIGQPEAFDEWSDEHRIPFISGDFLSRPVLEKAGAWKARALMYASGDDLLNLEGVVSAYGWMRSINGPVRLLWAHIANERLADTARRALRTEGRVGIRFFDTYRIAAAKMVAKYFNRDIRKGVRKIMILGFGKFGRDLTEVLMADRCADENFCLRVVDIQDRKKDVMALAGEHGFTDHISFFQSDVRDMNLADSDDKAFFLCTDDDIGNLAGALMLTRSLKGVSIYVRMAKWPLPAIEDHLSEKSGITFININDLVVEGVRELPGIFEPADEKDLKRAHSRGQGNK
ncbi:MAG: NAD-binding protein [Desulfococcaceae bacterium]